MSAVVGMNRHAVELVVVSHVAVSQVVVLKLIFRTSIIVMTAVALTMLSTTVIVKIPTHKCVRVAHEDQVKQWPWNNDEDQNDANDNANNEEELPEPQPDPTPVPVPDDPLPTPAPTPVPDPEPLPPEPLPDAGPTPSIPEDRAELNTYVAKQLGGFSRANHERNGATLDIYQARGKQRIVWQTAEAADWMSALGKVFYLKAVSGSSKAGLVLVCNDPDHPAPEPPLEPTPEPAPDQPAPIPPPDAEPLPAPETPPAPEPGEVPVMMLKACGGQDLVDAQMACEASGCWLVVVRRYGGQVNRVFYNPAN